MAPGQHAKIKVDLDAAVEKRLRERRAPVRDLNAEDLADMLISLAAIVLVASVVFAVVWYWGRDPLHPGWW